MFVCETDLNRACNGGANISLKNRQPHSENARPMFCSGAWDEDRVVGHYIEDDALDALALTGMLSGEDGISLTTSTSLNDFEDWIEGGDLDFVLVDIYRPDSRSFEDEVKRIRAHSNASIFFITGDEAKFYVDDALEVGAEGVLEKEALTATGLLEVLSNAVRARAVEAGQGASMRTNWAIPGGGSIASQDAKKNCAQPIAEGRQEWLALPEQPSQSSIDPERFETAQRYLNDAFKALADFDNPARADNALFGAIADAQFLLMAYAQNQPDYSVTLPRSVPRAIRDLQRNALSLAKQRGVKLAFQTTASVFDEAAMGQASICIRSLLKAVIIGTPKGETISFNGLSNADGIRLSITSTTHFPFHTDDLIERNLSFDNKNLPSTILMTALFMMLNLDASKFTVFRRKNIHTILIDIQDG